MTRAGWFELTMRYGNRKRRGREVLKFVIFEAYYQICKLSGYPAHHFIDPLPHEVMEVIREGAMIVWPPLPLWIRLLDRIVPNASAAHGDWLPYTPQAEKAARESGCRVGLVEYVRGEFRKTSG
jgi:hypothetical protein